jgi:hypothetical protein
MNSTYVKATILISAMVLFASMGSVSAFEEPTEGNKKLYALVKPMGDGKWKEVKPRGFFATSVDAKPGDNLMIIVYNMGTGELLPEGKGFIKAWEPASGSSSLLLEGAGEGDIQLPEWARTEGEESAESNADKLMTVLNEGTNFKRRSGVILPVFNGLPKKMKVKIGAKGFEDLVFILKLGGGSSGSGKEIDEIYLEGGRLRKGIQAVVKVSKNDEEVKAKSIEVIGPEGRPLVEEEDTSYVEFVPKMEGEYTAKVEMPNNTFREYFRTEGYTPDSGSASFNWGTAIALILIAIAITLTVEYKWNPLGTSFGRETETI